MGLLFYTTSISVDLAYHETFRANVCKGGINTVNSETFARILFSQIAFKDIFAT